MRQILAQFDERVHGPLLLSNLDSEGRQSVYRFDSDDASRFRFEQIPLRLDDWFFVEGSTHPRDLVLGHTRSKETEEFWGIRIDEAQAERSRFKIRRAVVTDSDSNLIVEDLVFPTHPKYMNPGAFALGDLDGDGLDEIALIEHTGDPQPCDACDFIHIDNSADYLVILKWLRGAYLPIWTSSAINDIGGKLMIDSLTGDGRQQLVVGTARGTVQIWAFQ